MACEHQGSSSGHGSWQQTPLPVGAVQQSLLPISFSAFIAHVFGVPLIYVCLHFEQGACPHLSQRPLKQVFPMNQMKLTLAFDELSVISIPASSRTWDSAVVDLKWCFAGA